MKAHLTLKERKVIRKFKNTVLDKFSNQILEIKLFGSKARGDVKRNSDIDLLIVTKEEDWRLGDRIGEIAFDLLLEEGIYLSTKVVSKRHLIHLQKLAAPFIENVMREGITL